MGKLDKFIICICLLAMIKSTVEENEEKRKKHENDALHHEGSFQAGSWTPGKPRRLFARTRFELQQRLQRAKSRTVTVSVGPSLAPQIPPVLPARAAPPVAPVVVRRCPGSMEACSPHTPCCDPCAICHCRLFNTICHCWRMSHLCPKKT